MKPGVTRADQNLGRLVSHNWYHTRGSNADNYGADAPGGGSACGLGGWGRVDCGAL